jgi:ParB family chromosome partitioning protein
LSKLSVERVKESVVVGEPGMSEGRRGLGRGLSALLGEVDSAPAQAPGDTVGGSREAPIELIRRNPDQPRRTFREDDLVELSDSIREKGVLQPILVRPAPGAAGEYQIVAGERRWRAAQRAGLKTIPIMIRELDDLAVLEIGIIENVQRADLNALEEALSYKVLMDRFARTQEAIAQTVGKSRSHVANTLRLLALPEAVQSYLTTGELTAGHARAIASAPDPTALAKEVIDKGLSVRDAEALARRTPNAAGEVRAKPTGGRPARSKDTDTQSLEADLSSLLGLDVEIDDRGGAGALTIRYATLEQLDDLCNRLTRSA